MLKPSLPPTSIRRVVADHEASYPDPIIVRRGDFIFPTDRTEEWDGHLWIWAAAGVREGWVPDDLIEQERETGPARAAYDYSALELSITAGETVAALGERHGWVWCVNDEGDEGWAPARALEIADGDARPGPPRRYD